MLDIIGVDCIDKSFTIGVALLNHKTDEDYN